MAKAPIQGIVSSDGPAMVITGNTVINSIILTNHNNAVVKYRYAVVPTGTTLANQHYRAFDTELLENDTVNLLCEKALELLQGWEVWLGCDTAGVSFNIDPV